MLWTKRLFLVYLGVFGLLSMAALATLPFAPARDPNALYASYAINLRSLDPAVSYDVISGVILGHTYEGLYDYAYGVRPAKVIPTLATAFPTLSDDGLTYTIPIRHGVHFQAAPGEDQLFPGPNGLGPEVTADDFVYSYKRLADSRLASPSFSAFLQGKVVGLDAFFDASAASQKAGKPTDYSLPVQGLVALDRYTLQIHLTQPNPQFIFSLASPSLSAVCRRAVEFYGDSFRARPVGTGPYCFKSYRADYRVVLTASPSYRGRPDADPGTVPADQRLPYQPTVIYDYFAETLPLWHAFQQGLYDSMELPKEGFLSAVDTTTRSLRPDYASRGMRLTTITDPAIDYYGFNLRDPVLGKNKPLRQAMCLAWDREAFIRKYLAGRGMTPRGFIPPGFPISDLQPENPFNHYDIVRAKSLMKEAELINGGPIPPLKLLFDGSDSAYRQYAEAFQSAMAQIGVKINIDPSTYARLLELVDARNFQICMTGWQADYPDEQTFLQMFYSKLADPGGVNMFGYNNPEFDALYERAIKLSPGPDRNDLYCKMVAMADEDCPMVEDYIRVRYYVSRSWLANYDFPDYGNAHRAFQKVDVAARKQALQSGHH